MQDKIDCNKINEIILIEYGEKVNQNQNLLRHEATLITSCYMFKHLYKYPSISSK